MPVRFHSFGIISIIVSNPFLGLHIFSFHVYTNLEAETLVKSNSLSHI